MKNIFAFVVILSLVVFTNAFPWNSSHTVGTSRETSLRGDSTMMIEHTSVMVIPYMPTMHLSDADPDISEGSNLEVPEMREKLRMGIVKELNKNFAEVYDVRGINNDFVKNDNREMAVLYRSIFFASDSVYTLKNPKRFAVKDTSSNLKGVTKTKPETKYINVGIYDSMLIRDLSRKYDADYLIFLNEIDIKTHSEDCINLALKIYRRDIKIHYSIFDRNGRQIYGDVAVSDFASNANDVNEIMKENFPGIANYILASFNRAIK